MDILYSDKLRVKVTFYQSALNFKQECVFFDKEIDCYNSEKYLTIEENRVTYIKFECDDINAKLYMDGLETIQGEIAKEDYNYRVYISPSGEKLCLYDIDKFPLIPGYYRIIVKTNEMNLYTRIKVTPKLIKNGELDIIKRDIEDEINGLAFELIRKNIGIGNVDINKFPIHLCRFFLIKDRYNSIMAALEDIKIRPNFKIYKEYKKISSNEIKCIDEKTIISYVNGTVEEGFLMEPVTSFNYDLSENQWIKKVIKELKKYLDDFIMQSNNFLTKKQENVDSIRNNRNMINEEVQSIDYLQSLIELARKMRNSINKLSNIEWLRDVSEKSNIYISHTLYLDSRYNCIYKLYRDLKNNYFKVRLDDSYAFQWKRSDKLYEMWCFIKVYRMLTYETFGFKIENGWIYDYEKISNDILIPELEKGTTIRLKKDNMYINLIYDKEITYHSKDTSQSKDPLFITRSNNRPDGRMDIYIEDIYIGSIILEFKYRNGSYIANMNLWKYNYVKYQERESSSVVRQLTAYGDNCKTKFLFGDFTDVNPVKKVLVFYPQSNNNVEDIVEIEDHNLKFIKFNPSLLENAKCSIEGVIEELLDRAKRYRIIN